MFFEEHDHDRNQGINESIEGSDELLSDDELRLPESAHTLVRVHAVQAWLSRRIHETTLRMGEAALALQEAMGQAEAESGRSMRRREREQQDALLQRYQQTVGQEQARIGTYEEAQALLQEYIDHAGGERILVEFYLALEELVEYETQNTTQSPARSPRLDALADVQQRIERVGITYEED